MRVPDFYAAAATLAQRWSPARTRRPHYGVTRVEASPYGRVSTRSRLATAQLPSGLYRDEKVRAQRCQLVFDARRYGRKHLPGAETVTLAMRSVVVSIFCEMLSIALRREAADLMDDTDGSNHVTPALAPQQQTYVVIAGTAVACQEPRRSCPMSFVPPSRLHLRRVTVQSSSFSVEAPMCRVNVVAVAATVVLGVIPHPSARAGAGDWRHGVRRRAAHRGQRKCPDRERDAGGGRHEDSTGRQGRRRSRARGCHAREPGRQDCHADACRHTRPSGSTREVLTRDLRRRAYYGVSAALSLGADNYELLDMRGQAIAGAARFFSAGRGITMPEPGRITVPHWITTEAGRPQGGAGARGAQGRHP